MATSLHLPRKVLRAHLFKHVYIYIFIHICCNSNLGHQPTFYKVVRRLFSKDRSVGVWTAHGASIPRRKLMKLSSYSDLLQLPFTAYRLTWLVSVSINISYIQPGPCISTPAMLLPIFSKCWNHKLGGSLLTLQRISENFFTVG